MTASLTTFVLAALVVLVIPGPGVVYVVTRSLTNQFLFLGLVYVSLAICTDGLYAVFASSLRNFITERFVSGPVPRCTSGFVHLRLGASLALTDRNAP